MRRVPCASSTTRPASFSRRRWRDTAGRLIGSASASSRTDRSPEPNSSTIARRFGSPSASNGSPAGALAPALTWSLLPGLGAHAVVARVVLDLGEPELLEHGRHVIREPAA